MFQGYNSVKTLCFWACKAKAKGKNFPKIRDFTVYTYYCLLKFYWSIQFSKQTTFKALTRPTSHSYYHTQEVTAENFKSPITQSHRDHAHTFWTTEYNNTKAMIMKTLELRPPPAYLNSCSIYFSLLFKNFIRPQ